MKCGMKCGTNCRRKCCVRPGNTGLCFVTTGLGIFLAYAIPRYILIALLGAGLIGVGICLMLKTH